MKRTMLTFCLGVLVVISLAGCLTVERKSYKITMTGKQSGTCTITYHNIVSAKDDGKDVSFKDFAELVTDYLEGTKLEDEMEGCRNVKKRIYEEKGQLMGEITFDFDTLSTVKMFRYDDTSPLMMYMGGMSSEKYADGNGEFGGESMPVVFWPAKSKDINLTTTVTEIDTSHVSLVDHYAMWKKRR